MKTILKLFSALFLMTVIHSCSNTDDLPIDPQSQMKKLAAPVIINLDSTVLELSDYTLRPQEVDSARVCQELTVSFSADSTKLIIRALTRDFPKLSAMTLWSKGFPYTLLLEKTPKIWYRFTFDPGTKKHKRVQIKGQMNEWNPAAGYLFEKDGKWHIDFNLFPGKYQYKLILDSKEVSDPNNKDSVSNGSGGYNSLLILGNVNSPNLPWLYTKTSEGKSVVVGIKNDIDTAFVLWQNHLLDHSFWSVDSSGLRIKVPNKAKSFERSYIRVWAVNKTGISNTVLIPLQDGKVLDDPGKITRNDREAMILYFMMVDRFRNGNKENDAPVNDPEIDPKVNYKGGDLAGIYQALKDGYFEQLGINTLWISPITQNPLIGFNEYPAPHRKFSGYHGYWPITLTTVDTRFGTSDDLHQLVKSAHGEDMNVVLDFVSHHVHQDYPVLKTHPDWITTLDLPDGRKNIRHWDEHRLTTWFDVFLPTFDLTKPEVAEMVSDSATFWIKEYKLDGFRHDAAKHVPENYWRMLTKKLNEQVMVPEERDVYQIGETFGSRDLVGSYINPGMLDAQFEFNLYWDVKWAFATDWFSFRDLNYSLMQTFSYYGEHNLMGNITGNQDMSRFISYASGALSPNEKDVEAGWSRDIHVKDTIGYQRLASLQAFNMTIPGIPVIYYGDEFGMPGAGDPDNRRMMKFDSLNRHEQWLKETTSKLAKLRSASLPLIYGDFKTLKVTDQSYVYIRSYFDKAVIVFFNKDNDRKKIEIEVPDRFRDAEWVAQFGKQLSREGNKLILEIPGSSFEILKNQP